MNDTDDPFKRLVRLNERANRRDQAALNELTGLLVAESSVWTEFTEQVKTSVDKWARLLSGGDERAMAEAVRLTAEWSTALAGENPTPVVRAAAAAAGVAFLAVRFGEAEVSTTAVGKRRVVLRRLKVGVKRLQQAVELVVAAKAAAAPAARPRPRVPVCRKPTIGRTVAA